MTSFTVDLLLKVPTGPLGVRASRNESVGGTMPPAAVALGEGTLVFLDALELPRMEEEGDPSECASE